MRSQALPIVRKTTPLGDLAAAVGLGAILRFCCWKELPGQLAPEGGAPQSLPVRVRARLMILGLLLATFWTVRKASAHWERGHWVFVK